MINTILWLRLEEDKWELKYTDSLEFFDNQWNEVNFAECLTGQGLLKVVRLLIKVTSMYKEIINDVGVWGNIL